MVNNKLNLVVFAEVGFFTFFKKRVYFRLFFSCNFKLSLTPINKCHFCRCLAMNFKYRFTLHCYETVGNCLQEAVPAVRGEPEREADPRLACLSK